MKVYFLIALVLLFCHTAFAQEETPAAAGGIDHVYLAKDDGTGKAGEQVSDFGTTDIPIYCVVLLEASESAIVKMNFVAVSVSGVKADTKVVTASFTTKAGQNRVNFAGRPDGEWTPGKYRVDLFLNGKKTKELEFIIKSQRGAVNSAASAVKNFQTTGTPSSKPKKRDR